MFCLSQIGAVKERKKKFDKQTAKFCASQERWELVLVEINQSLINNIQISGPLNKENRGSASRGKLFNLLKRQEKFLLIFRIRKHICKFGGTLFWALYEDELYKASNMCSILKTATSGHSSHQFSRLWVTLTPWCHFAREILMKQVHWAPG